MARVGLEVGAVEDRDDTDELDRTLVAELVDWTELDDLELVAADVSLYNSRRLPAPQYSLGFPGQMKLQSPSGACVEEAASSLPQ